MHRFDRWAAGSAGLHRPPHLLTQLRADSPETVSRERKLPLPVVRGVATFYEEIAGPKGDAVCIGTSCRFAGGAPRIGARTIRCAGRCFAPPALLSEDDDPAMHRVPRKSLVECPIVLGSVLGCEDGDPFDLPDGATILERVIGSGLRGRGGAAFPTGLKWDAARRTSAPDRVVVANGDEGDPGAFVDRLLLEESPHTVLAGMLACARAIGAKTGIVFVRGEYPAAARAMESAIETARHRMGGELEVRVVRGAGSYLAGEETALLRAIEGLRAEPSPKPPYPAERGLFGLPTVVQNVETLASVPYVARHGVRGDTKVVSLAGAVAWRGAIEVRFGTPLSEILSPLPGRPWKMALVGGPLGRVLPASELDVPLSYDALPGLGHAGVVVFDQNVSVRALAEHLFEFAAAESCGTCTPCRAGTPRLSQMRDAASLMRLLDTLEMGSLCGFGQAVPRPLRDLIAHYPEEIFG